MVDLKQFGRNVKRSGEVSPGLLNRAKYLYWSYSSKLPVMHSLTMKLRFPELDPLTLMVRTNRSDMFIAGEVFDQKCYDIDLDFAPKTILDLGGNIGFSTIYYKRRYPGADVAVVEPIPDNLKLLRRNLAMNGVEARVFEGAISIEPGTINMQLSDKPSEHKVSGNGAGDLEVRGYSIPEIIKEMGWDSIDLLKVDVEGYEYELLQKNTDWLEKVGVMIMELHPPFTQEEFEALMKSKGFTTEELPEGLLLVRRT